MKALAPTLCKRWRALLFLKIRCQGNSHWLWNGVPSTQGKWRISKAEWRT